MKERGVACERGRVQSQKGAWLCVKGGVACFQSTGDAHRALQWGKVGWGLGWLHDRGVAYTSGRDFHRKRRGFELRGRGLI